LTGIGLFEIKHDGFRASATRRRTGTACLRNRNQFASFGELCEQIAKLMPKASAILDGEIVCTDEQGCSQFNELLFRRGVPRFFAFDLLWLGGRDLRSITLIERKHALRSLLPKQGDHLLYVNHVEGQGERLFDLVCHRDLEGVVAKHRYSRYSAENGNHAWIKIRNPNYSQIVGRENCSSAITRPRAPRKSAGMVCLSCLRFAFAGARRVWLRRKPTIADIIRASIETSRNLIAYSKKLIEQSRKLIPKRT